MALVLRDNVVVEYHTISIAINIAIVSFELYARA